MRLLPALRIFSFCLFLAFTACTGHKRLSIHDRPAVADMTAALGQVQVVFIGEFHDQRDHHLLQLELIKSLYSHGKKLVIALEMFDLEKQHILDEWVRGETPLNEFVARYQKGWRINWAEYDSIMLFARNNRIQLVALDTPPDIVKRVTYKGAGALGHEALRRLPDNITTEMPPSYRKFMSMAFRTHDIPDFMFDNFCAAQGLRNSTMAERIAGFLKENPRKSMVVIAGVGHVMRSAVPSFLAKKGISHKIVIPKVEGLYEELSGDDMDYFVSFEE